MTSLRERLAAKERRRLVVPIQISDSSEEERTWMGAVAAHQHQFEKGAEANADLLSQLEKQVDAANDRFRAHYADVTLQALSRADWEAATAKWQTEDGEPGQMDWAAALAPLLAESCVDEDLQDEQWWRDTLTQPNWTEGDVDSLRAALLQLNVYALEARYPKGWAATSS